LHIRRNHGDILSYTTKRKYYPKLELQLHLIQNFFLETNIYGMLPLFDEEPNTDIMITWFDLVSIFNSFLRYSH
jgi:hypothetical protein